MQGAVRVNIRWTLYVYLLAFLRNLHIRRENVFHLASRAFHTYVRSFDFNIDTRWYNHRHSTNS
jgi:hypothetical protein